MQIELMDFFSVLVQNIPEIAVWVIGIGLSLIMIKRGGGRLEKILLIGCCLMLVIQFVNPTINLVYSSMYEADNISRADVARTYGITRAIYSVVLGIPALVLVVYAFWKKFWKKKDVKV